MPRKNKRDKTAPEYQQMYDKLFATHRRWKQRHRELTGNHCVKHLSRSTAPALKLKVAHLEKQLKEAQKIEPRLKKALEGNKLLKDINEEHRQARSRMVESIQKLQNTITEQEELIAQLRHDAYVAKKPEPIIRGPW